MTFTDEDLAFIKECYKKTPEGTAFTRAYKLKEMISRLEAAERIVEGCMSAPGNMIQGHQLYEAWRKAAGKKG